MDNATGSDASLIPAATQRINEDVVLQTRTVAQAESTRNYFLAQTLESTRTVPIVSADLPLDTSAVDVVIEDNAASQEEEGEDGEDDPDSAGLFVGRGPAPANGDAEAEVNGVTGDAVQSAISPASTVIGSFTSNGITLAVEPGGETVAVVAVDYNQLPEQFINAKTVVVPTLTTADGIDVFTVSRIADYAFANVNEGITAVTIPASIVSIEADAFAGADTLQYLIVSDDNPIYSSYDGALYDADEASLLLIPEGRLGAVHVPVQAVNIPEDVSSHCASLTMFIVSVDGAASQLLEANDLYNANNEPIEVLSADDERAATYELYAPDYEAVVAALGGDASDLVATQAAAPTTEQAATYAAGATDWATAQSIGWMDPNYLDYVAYVYSSDPSDPGYVDLSERVDDNGNKPVPSVGISKQAVEAGEYYLIGGGYNDQGMLPAKTIDGVDGGVAWWEITARTPLKGDVKTDTSTRGTLRIHCDNGAVIQHLGWGTGYAATAAPEKTSAYLEEEYIPQAKWRWAPYVKHTYKVVFDHVDTVDCGHWFSNINNNPWELNHIEHVDILGNHFPPSATSIHRWMYSQFRLGSLSSNFTLAFANAMNYASNSFCQVLSLGSLPDEFAWNKNSPVYYSFWDNVALKSLPDSFDLSFAKDEDLASTAFQLTAGATYKVPKGGQEYLREQGQTNLLMYYNGSDALTNSIINGTYKFVEIFAGAKARSPIINSPSLTWNARSGSFAAGDDFPFSNNDGRAFDCSRVQNLKDASGNFVSTLTVPNAPRKANDKFIGWFTNEYDAAKNMIVWKEVPTVNNGTAVLNSGKTTSYYAVYESDHVVTDISFDLNGADSGATTPDTIRNQGIGLELPNLSLNGTRLGNDDTFVPTKAGYVFDGFWTQPVGGTQYYDESGQRIKGLAWGKSSSTTLYAHWVYKVKFNMNVSGFVNTNGDTCEAVLDPNGTFEGTPGYYTNLVYEDGELPYIWATYGAPIQVPEAAREGFSNTRAWGMTPVTTDVVGFILPVANVDGGFWSVQNATSTTKVDPPKATLIVNTGSGFPPTCSPTNGVLLLHADWTGTVAGMDKTLTGGPKSYKVALRSTYTYNTFDYVSSQTDDVSLGRIQYNSIITNRQLSALTAPKYVSGTYNNLRFRGFCTEPNAPDAESATQGVRFIRPRTSDDAGVQDLYGTNTPFRIAPANDNDTIILYALWTLPFCDMVFHMNEDALTAPVDFEGTVEDGTALYQGADGVLAVRAETDSATPALVEADGTATADGFTVAELLSAVPSHKNYLFNGWWTHPWKETGDSVQYYGPKNEVKHAVWDIYEDTVLYAHWKYLVVLDPNLPADAVDADKVKFQQILRAGENPEAGLVGKFDGNAFTDAAYGNTYNFTDSSHKYLVPSPAQAIEVTAGSAVLLPWVVSRTGYEDSLAWRAGSKTGDLVPVTESGWTCESFTERDEAAPLQAGSLIDASHTLTLYADWSGEVLDYDDVDLGGGAKGYAVNLQALYGSFASETIDPYTTKLTNVVFDSPFSSNTTNGKVVAPFRNGYTFLGYYTEKNPEVKDASELKGDRWVAEATGTLADSAELSSAKWTVVPDAGKTEVTLYAAWKKDLYTVAFAPSDLLVDSSAAVLSPGEEPVQVSAKMPATMQWGYGEQMSARKDFPIAAATPAATDSSDTPIFRKGYDFDGWYFVTMNTAGDWEPTMVCDALGQGDAKYVWAPSRAWQVANRTSTVPVFTLYGAWTPKVYAVMFDINLPAPATTSLTYPLAAWMGDADYGTVGKTDDGRYFYEVAYEEDITPYFDSDGDPAKPTYLEYEFAYWGTDASEAPDATSPQNRLFASANQTSGKFTPDLPLASQVKGTGPVVNVITYYAHWTPPAAAELTLFADVPRDAAAGEAARGSFDPKDFSKLSATSDSDAAHLVFKNLPYGTVLPINATAAYHPALEDGYAFAGWVRANASGEAVNANGDVIDPYDAATGEPKATLTYVTDEDTRYLTGPNYYVAVYSRAQYRVELDMSGYTGYTFTTVGSTPWDKGYHVFNVEDAAFSLPVDVVMDGKKFIGWTRTSPTPAKDWAGTTIDPKATAAEVGAEVQVFEPRIVDRIYRVDFRSMNASDGTDGDVLYAYVNYDGEVLGGTLVTEGQAKVGDTLGMATAPKARLSSKASGIDDTFTSSIFNTWFVGSPVIGVGVERDADDATITAADWNQWLLKFANPLASIETVTLGGTTYGLTDTVNVYGDWTDKISAVCPLFVNMAVDVTNGAVAIPQKDFGIFGTSGGQDLVVAALRYESILDPADENGNTNAFKNASQPAYLNVFAGMTNPPVIEKPEVKSGVLSGAFGKDTPGGAHSNPLQINLKEDSRTFAEDVLNGYGFGKFSNRTDRLYLWYGLDLDGMKLDTLRAIGTALPKITEGKGMNADGWTNDSVRVARLFYTVRLAPSV